MSNYHLLADQSGEERRWSPSDVVVAAADLRIQSALIALAVAVAAVAAAAVGP